MKVTVFGLTDKGKIRSENQDRFLVDEKNGVFAVADGVGGLPLGGLASETAINTLKAFLARPSKKEDYSRLFNEINRNIWQAGVDAGEHKGIATTLTVAKLKKDALNIDHIGDCMVLLFNGKLWEECTTSHTAEKEIRNSLPKNKKIRLPERFSHTLTRCLGLPIDVDRDITHKKIKPGQRVLICSDGVTKVLDNDILLKKVIESTSAEDYVKNIMAEVNARGSPDNATAIALFFD